MKENIEEDRNKISNLIDYINNADYVDTSQCFDVEDISAIENILSDYKRLQKENLRLRYQDIPYLEGEIKGYKTRIEELKKEKEELAHRCRNLDQEAQGYLEALAGDNTLTKRDVKQLQEENKELRETVEEYDRTFDVFNERTYRKKYIEERRAEQPNLLFPDADEIYKRYYELKEENEELKYKYDRALGDLVKAKQKIKDKIESYKGLKIIDKSAYEEQIKPLIELLEEE